MIKRMREKVSRDKILKRTSWISTIGNATLSITKLVVGFLSGSLAVISDGIDSATDVIISLVMLYTARIISRPPDNRYVYGYEKAENISTKILSFIIFYAGVQMFISTIQHIFSYEKETLPNMIAVYITIFSIIGKLGLLFYQYKQGKRINSSMLIANAKNMRNDVIISLGVLLGLIFTFVFQLPILDSITGLIISLFIIRSGIKIFMESNVVLMDGVQDTSIYNKIFEAIEKVPGAYSPHRVRSRQMANMYMITLDIEVDGKLSVDVAHKIAQSVENSIKSSIENVYDIVVHVEPRGEIHEEEKFGIEKEML